MGQTDSDAQLVDQYLKGDEQALQFLYERHIPAVYNFILRLAPPGVDAEDVVQEAFIKAWRNLKRFDRTRSFKTWIFTIAKNTLLDQLKAKKTVTFSLLESGSESDEAVFEPVDQRPLPDAVLAGLEGDARMEAVLSSLPPAKRAVVVMHVFEDMSFREIGEVLGEPLDTVKTRYRRTIEALAKQLGQDRLVDFG